MKRLLPLFSIALVCFSGCKTGPHFDPRAKVGAPFVPVSLTNRLDPSWLQPAREPYRLGPGDVIDIETLGEAGTAPASVTIGPDGKVYYSLLPGLSVWGLTLAETRGLLGRELARYTRAQPTMVANLRSVGSRRIWVLGAVGSAGVFTLGTPVSLLEAIASAGGLASSGADDGTDLARSFVLRNGRRLPVNFERLFKNGDLNQNIYLEADDFVFVAPANHASVYVLGAVVSANVIPWSRDLTLSSALLSSGGAVKYAREHKVVIVRGSLDNPRIAEVDYKAIVTGKAQNVRLEPGDIVYVPFVPYRYAAILLEELVDQFVRTVAVNEGSYIGSGGKNNPVQISAPYGISTAAP